MLLSSITSASKISSSCMPSMPSVCQRDKFINATTTIILILVDGVLFKFNSISAIRAALLQPLAELCIPRCSDLTIKLFQIEHNGGPGLDLALAQPSSWETMNAFGRLVIDCAHPRLPLSDSCAMQILGDLWWRRSNDRQIRSTIQTVLYVYTAQFRVLYNTVV